MEVSPTIVPGARHAVAPVEIASTAWPRIEKTCRNIGWRFDPWQRAVGRLILSRKADGSWASDLSIMSIPRQVGKSYLLGCIIFALCLLQPKLRVIWTSHHTATTEEMYEAMKELASHKSVEPHIVACTALQGSRWRIKFRNGSRIDFGARERGFGRGKANVGVLVLDEFQHISMRALSNLTPTTNTADNPLILCAGTPPAPIDNGEAFAMRRKAAIDGISTGTFYVEFSADSDADPDDRKQWAKANPSFPKRTPERAFLLNRKILDDESFRREFLGIWDSDDNSTRLITPDEWKVTGTTSVPSGIPSLAVAFSRDGDRQAVAGSIKHDGGVHVELIGAHSGSTEAGVASLVSWLCEENDGAPRWRRYAWIALCGKAGASTVHKELRDRGVPEKAIKVLTLAEYLAACSLFHEDIKAKTVTHSAIEGQKALDDSVAVCDRKFRGADGAWGWEPTTADGDETPIEAVSVAHWAARTTKREPGRRQVLL